MDLDVAVVGASSSGLYAAGLLAEAGLKVALFEGEEGPPAPRTLIVTHRLSRMVAFDGAVLNRVRVIRLSTAKRAADVVLEEADLVLERSKLLAELEERARRAGAEVLYGYRFRGFLPCRGGVVLRFGRGDVRAKAVIGADGATSDVARAAGIALPPSAFISQAKVRSPGWDPSVVHVRFSGDGFFCWIIPESEEVGVVGVIGKDSCEAREALGSFLRSRGLEPSEYQEARVSLYHPSLKPLGSVGGARVLLVGDAAGQVKVTTMGGLVAGLRGAAAAARSIVRGTSYLRELGPLRRELDLHWLIRSLLSSTEDGIYDTLIKNITPQVRRVLGRYTRDELSKLLVHISLSQPRLPILGLKLSLKSISRWPI